MQREHQESGGDLLLDCLSSPFDHEADFVPLDSPNAKGHGSVKATTRATRSGTGSQRKRASNTVDLASSSSSSSTTTTTTTTTTPSKSVTFVSTKSAPSAPLLSIKALSEWKPGLEQLAEALNYRMESFPAREVAMLRADALTLIEKLTTGKVVTRRARELDWGTVAVILHSAVPDEYFGSLDPQDVDFSRTDLWWDNTLARAVARYITALKTGLIERQREVVASRTEVRDLPQQRQQRQRAYVGNCIVVVDHQRSVEKTLEKIETWCDRWLNGKILDADWDKMEAQLQKAG